MKKIIAITIVGIITLSGLGVVAISNSETEFWGVVVVALDTSQQPYIYNSLRQSNNWKSDQKLLWMENATKGEILNSIDWLIENADNDDIVLFSVDCHGTYQNGEYGIWPWDGYDNGMISVAELDAKFDQINSMGLCLIFDCCLSGSFIDTYHGDKVRKNFYTFRSPRSIIPESIIYGVEDDNRVIIMGTMPRGWEVIGLIMIGMEK